jgi:hypothetical protein
MLYNDLVELIKKVAEEINPSGTFIHGRNSDGSLAFAGKMPQIHLYPFITVKDRPSNSDSSDMLMGFWFQDKPSTSNEQRQAIIAKADLLCNQFIDGIEATGVIQVKSFTTEPQYRMQAGTLSGYALRFTIISTSETNCN